MNKIEHAYLAGFIKAAGGGFNQIEEALAAGAKAAKPATSKALTTQLGTPAVNMLPQDAYVAAQAMNTPAPLSGEALKAQILANQQSAQRQYSALTSGNAAEQGMTEATHAAELAARMKANPERGLMVLPKPGENQSFADTIKSYLSNAKNKITGLPGAMKDKAVAGADAGMDAIKGNPGKAALGGLGLSGAAHYGGQAAGQLSAAPGNAAHQISLKNPDIAKIEFAEAAQRNNPTDGILDKLVGSIKQHPYYWGGGAAAAAGAGGLHYYLNKNKREKDQPGGDPELT